MEELLKEIDRLEDIVTAKTKEFDEEWFLNTKSHAASMADFENYSKKRNEACQPELAQLNKLETKLRMTKTPEFSKLSSFGSVMTLNDFISNVKCGGFIDYDGFGHYVKDGKESDIEIYPSDVKKGNLRKEFDTIIWFNR